MKKISRRLTALAAAVFLLTGAASAQMLVPGGCAAGIKLYTRGLMVTGFEEESAAKEAGIKKGDIILEADGTEISTTAQLREHLQDDAVALTVLRKGREAEFCIRPKEKQLGAYVQDSIGGIGTITYYDPLSGTFGALGHGVSEFSTSQLVPVTAGTLIEAEVASVEKGRSGAPGELKGTFDAHQILGQVERNGANGIFGTLSVPISAKPLPVGQAKEIKPGKATILSNVEGSKVRSYDVEILKIYPHDSETGRNLLLKVTDAELLQKTGGIVQGMSGSPIIQDGKLIGAVTHVLVNDPTKGYGIFIENMLQ